MANNYYQRIYDYQPRTKAKGEHVRGDLTAIEDGFDLLPPHNGKGTGFDPTFEVFNPTGAQNPIPYHYFRYWPEDIDANGYLLKGLPEADKRDGDHVASVGYVTSALAEANDPNVHPGDALAWTWIARGGETSLSPPFQFHNCSVFINGVFQDPYSAYEIREKRHIDLNGSLMEDDIVTVLMGMNAPPVAESLVYEQPMSVCINYSTPVRGNHVFARMGMPVEARFPAGVPGSSAYCTTAPEKIFVVNFTRNAELLGWLSFLPGSLEGQYSWVNDVVLAPGDILKIQAQIGDENEISGLSFVLHGFRRVS